MLLLFIMSYAMATNTIASSGRLLAPANSQVCLSLDKVGAESRAEAEDGAKACTGAPEARSEVCAASAPTSSFRNQTTSHSQLGRLA